MLKHANKKRIAPYSFERNSKSLSQQKTQPFFIIPLFPGIILTVLFLLDITLPYEILIPISGATFVSGFIFIRVTHLSLLPRLAITLYSLPFTATIGYLFDRYHMWTYPNPVRAQYMWNHTIISQMVMVGLIGLLGLLTGIMLKEVNSPQSHEVPLVEKSDSDKHQHFKTLDAVLFAVILIMAVMFSWMHAPPNTIFAGAYTSIKFTAAKKVGLTSAALISYILLLLLYLDAEREAVFSLRRIWKFRVLLAATLFIVVFFQILRGDRESISLITAFVALYLTSSDRKASTLPKIAAWQKIKKIIVPAMLIILAYLTIGSLRSKLSEQELSSINLGESIQEGLRSATWNGILLSSLNMAGQYYEGHLELLYGSTYIEYVLSLPPGFVANAIGWERPIDSSGDPSVAWFPKGATAGGIHAALVPFRNFGALGVFVILAGYGILISSSELANTPDYFWGRLIYASVVCYINRWFWYGDINIIRTLIIAVVAGIMYNILTSFSWTRKRTSFYSYRCYMEEPNAALRNSRKSI